MSSSLRVALAIVVFELILPAHVSTARAQQKPLTSDQRQIVDTISTIFAAARTNDVAKFDSVIASDFYIFDGGTRFNGDAIMGFIKAQHAAGRRYDWNVTEPDVHVSCNTAWITYTNEGSITDASGTTNQNWLESAFLEKQAGTWKVIFMHSTRVPRTSQNQVLGQLPSCRHNRSISAHVQGVASLRASLRILVRRLESRSRRRREVPFGSERRNVSSTC